MNTSGKMLEYEDELLAELQKEQTKTAEEGLQNEPESITQPEAEKKLGLNSRKTKEILHSLCDAGKLKRQMILRVNAWGYTQHIPGYKLARRE